MFNRHPHRLITAYIQNELDESRAAHVRAHLERCRSCAAHAARLAVAHDRLTKAPPFVAPEHMWHTIESRIGSEPVAATLMKAPPLPLHPTFVGRGREDARMRLAAVRALAVAAASCVLGILAIATHWLRRPPVNAGPYWQVTRISGTPQVESAGISKTGRLGVGQWLETDAHSQAEITVSDIGRVKVEPNTRIGLETTRLNEHRLSLQRGEMSARVLAPPRLFLVDTPSSTAVDLGCEYTLKVDAAGDTELHVLTGHVALMRPTPCNSSDREINVPTGGYCRTRKGAGPGTPYFGEASAAFRSALYDYDMHVKVDISVATMLSEAQQMDTISLWYMLTDPKQPPDRRARILSTMVRLVPPENGVTPDALVRGDAGMMQRWHQTLQAYW